MKITVISSSPHRNGTSARLVSEFIRGAEEKGHEVFRFDAAFEDIHSCIACYRCVETGEGCVFKDSMEKLNPHLLDCDLIAFATPIYYYNMNGQLRTVIDRFFANNEKLMGTKKSVLMMTCEDDTTESVDGPILSYQNMLRYMKWEDCGVIAALNCGDMESMDKTEYPQKAYELGYGL
ncbi:MAG: flavodoxin family protein [Firmicutes bacterium]|nr:flavodoxin family protein [Bacillota bacterium]